MRLEAKAALAIGVLLPVLETWRRGLGTWWIDFTTMFEDYLAAALLLLLAVSASALLGSFRRASRNAPAIGSS